VLEGQERVSETFDGWQSGLFQSVCHDSTGTDTIIHWRFPKGSVAGDGIQPGETVHVGWSVDDHNSRPRDMYWTDEGGGRIPGSKIMTVTGHIGTGGITFSNGTPDYVRIGNPRFVQVDVPYALADLNQDNVQLMSRLAPLGPPEFTLAPGQSLTIAYPSGVASNPSVVAVYQANAAGDDAETLVFVQDRAQ
jgi:hypothetical protein